MRRPVSGSGRLAPLDGGSSRRSGVMRLCSSEQPAHISLIRRRSRSIVSRASASSGIHPHARAQCAHVNIDREIEDARTTRLTAGPSISAISLIRHRLFTAYGGKAEYEVVGEPVSLPDARVLAEQDKFQFQWWALGLVGARPTEQKKGADKGIDGRLYFHDEPGGKTKQIILSVKGGGLKATDVRDLRGVLEREKAEIGVLITLDEPTKPMRAEAASAGFYRQPVVDQGGQQYPRLQILTVGELLEGKRIKYPTVGYLNVTLKKAPKARGKQAHQLPLVAENAADYEIP